MSLTRILAATLLAVGVYGCGVGSDAGAELAVKIVQEFKPSTASVPLTQRLNAGFSNEEWSVEKTSEDLYRVTFKGSASGKSKDLKFGVSIHNKSVMALNSEALSYTDPL
jgi:hypothetical protein